MRTKITSCRLAWDKKDFDYLRDALQCLRGAHDRWSAAFLSFRRIVRAPFYDATPMERKAYEAAHFEWLSVELDAWQKHLPAMRRFAKPRDPKSILRVQKLLATMEELEAERGKLGKTVNAVLDPQMMEYFNYHPPQITQKA